MPTKGAISQQTSPLPSNFFPYPSPTQDPVAPPKRVVVGRTAALRLRLRPCLTPSSKNYVKPSSGCRQGGDSTLNLATALGLSLLPVTHPRPRRSTKTSPPLSYGSTTATSSSLAYTCKQNQVESSSGCRHGGDFKKKLATALGLSFLPAVHPRPRCSTETSRRRPYSNATAPSSSLPNTCKQKAG